MKKTYTLLAIAFLFLTQFSIAQPCWMEMKGGRSHSVALRADHTIWVWGGNGSYQLGNGTQTSSANPIQLGTDSDWVQTAVGDDWTLAIKSNGTLWIWGKNQLGYLAGQPEAFTIPTQIGNDTDWRAVSTGRFHSMAIKTNGTLWGWGQNVDGNVGDGTLIDRLVPTQIGTATDWQRIYQGYYHSFGIKTNGSLWGWGFNEYGSLGDGTNVDKIVPTQIGTATNWSEISGGNVQSIAVKTNGTLWSTGANWIGQLGDGTTIDKNTWTQIAVGETFTKTATGVGHTIALNTDGTIWTWGLNNAGQIGNGSMDNFIGVLSPIQIGTATNWISVAVGSHNTFAMTTSGTNWAWGLDGTNLLGVGSPDQYVLVPTSVNNCRVLENEEIIPEVSFAKAYPNPTSSILNIATTTGIYVAELYDMQGRLVLSEQIKVTEHQMDISYLTKGTYLLKLTSEDNVQTIRIIKD